VLNKYAGSSFLLPVSHTIINCGTGELDEMTLDWLYNHNYNHPTACGVYVLVDMMADKLYVGSSVDLTRRATQHFRSLEEGVHHNRNLQYLWDLHGASSFSFIVLEHVGDRLQLESREQTWLNRLRERALNRVWKIQRDDEWKTVDPANLQPLAWSDEGLDLAVNSTPVEDVLQDVEPNALSDEEIANGDTLDVNSGEEIVNRSSGAGKGPQRLMSKPVHPLDTQSHPSLPPDGDFPKIEEGLNG
jgi:hypothetical protein